MELEIRAHYTIDNPVCVGTCFDIEVVHNGISVYTTYTEECFPGMMGTNIDGFVAGVEWANGEIVKIKETKVSDRAIPKYGYTFKCIKHISLIPEKGCQEEIHVLAIDQEQADMEFRKAAIIAGWILETEVSFTRLLCAKCQKK